jgi:YesN/AraC family two-component response regulator
MDINMPYVDGIDGVKLIKKDFPEIKIIMQTIFED